MQFLNKPFTDIVKVGKKTLFTWEGLACFTMNTHFPPKQLYPRNMVNFEDRTKFVRLVLTHIWQGEYNYSEFHYSVNKLPSTVICKTHGKFKKTYDNHARGQGCLECSRTALSKSKSKGFDSFVQDAEMVHGKRYLYPEQEYVNIDEPLVITCRVHGDFLQTPYRHVNKQNGCNKCSTVSASRKLKQRGLGGWSKDDYCKLSPKSNLYVVHLVVGDEEFYKIGISKNLKKRFNQIKRDTGSTPTLLLKVCEDSTVVWDLEKHIHKLLTKFKYKPSKQFVGHTECFANIDIVEVHKELLKFIESKEINSDNSI